MSKGKKRLAIQAFTMLFFLLCALSGWGQDRVPNLPRKNLKNFQQLAGSDITITTDNSFSAEQLAQALVGPGVTVSGVTSRCAPEAMGMFTVSGASVFPATGIILSSGAISNVIGPNTSSGRTQSFGTAGDPDLDLLSGKTTYDACLLEFDFFPGASAMSFQYLFGSEEYNEYVNSSFNDVFGFFINGQNCALVNGSPVSINTINGGNPYDPSGVTGANPEHYINNDNGQFNTELDGFTTILTCQSLVKPGLKNHMKLAIADASDTLLDSDVFIGAGTFQSVNYNFKVTPSESEATINSGITTTYGLELQNTGGKADSYSAAVSGNGWATTLSANTFGPVNPLGNAFVDVSVSIPKSATIGATDTATLTFTSQGDPSKVFTATITTTANGTACSFDRDLPEDGYLAGIKVPVMITAVPSCVDENNNVWAVAETIPTGWTVSDISDGGTFLGATGAITWIFSNNAAVKRLLSYKATPPSGTTGSMVFNGIASVSGVDYPVSGDASMDPNSGWHPADTNKDHTISISEFTAYGSAWKSGKVWPGGWNPIEISFVTNAASIWKLGGSYIYDATAGSAPACWQHPGAGMPGTVGPVALEAGAPLTAVRSLPAVYVAGEAVNISIEVTPDTLTSSYAVEETPPAGWTISDVSHYGTYVDGKIKWGLFTDNVVRKLSYRATPPSDASGTKIFTGNAAFDSVQSAITGDSSIVPASGSKIELKVSHPKNGSVMSIDGNISCTSSKTSDCTDTYFLNQEVLLTATPDPGYVFTGWTGACHSEKSPVCTVTVSQKTVAGAKFGKPVYYFLKVVNPLLKGVSRGSVTSSDGKIFCDGTDKTKCVTGKDYLKGDNPMITLTAVPAEGYAFYKWTGACKDTVESCTVTMNGNKTTKPMFLKLK